MKRARMDAGKLRQRMILERRTETADGCGGMTIGWVEEAQIWAALEPVSVQVAQEAQQQVETASHQVTIRYRSDVASGWRFVFGTRHLVIVDISDPDERGNYLVCTVEEQGR